MAAASRCSPELIIVDVRLGLGSGIAAVAEILRRGFVPHVFVSGGRLQRDILHPDAVVLQKPFDDGELARAMDSALNAGTPP